MHVCMIVDLKFHVDSWDCLLQRPPGFQHETPWKVFLSSRRYMFFWGEIFSEWSWQENLMKDKSRVCKRFAEVHFLFAKNGHLQRKEFDLTAICISHTCLHMYIYTHILYLYIFAYTHNTHMYSLYIYTYIVYIYILGWTIMKPEICRCFVLVPSVCASV